MTATPAVDRFDVSGGLPERQIPMYCKQVGRDNWEWYAEIFRGGELTPIKMRYITQDLDLVLYLSFRYMRASKCVRIAMVDQHGTTHGVHNERWAQP